MRRKIPLSSWFSEVEGASVLYKQSGAYKIGTLLERHEHFYLQAGSGIYKIFDHGETSSQKITWLEVFSPLVYLETMDNTRAPRSKYFGKPAVAKTA